MTEKNYKVVDFYELIDGKSVKKFKVVDSIGNTPLSGTFVSEKEAYDCLRRLSKDSDDADNKGHDNKVVEDHPSKGNDVSLENINDLKKQKANLNEKTEKPESSEISHVKARTKDNIKAEKETLKKHLKGISKDDKKNQPS